MEDAARANMAMFERAMQMFPAFTYPRAEPTPAASDDKAEPAPPPEAPDALDEMRRQMDEMRRQIEKLASGKSK
jgi:polyhydroxyalkanoate synthesis regulator protein